MPLLSLSCLFYVNLTRVLVALSLLTAQDLCTCSSFFLGYSPLIRLFELLFIKYSFTYLFYSGWDRFPFPTEIRLVSVICLGIGNRMSASMTQIMICNMLVWQGLSSCPSVIMRGTRSSWPACLRRLRLTWHRPEHNFQVGAPQTSSDWIS